MISYDAALNIIVARGKNTCLGDETVHLADIAGRLCAETITAPLANQPFDNSAMDGFALRAEDLATAADGHPVALRMIGHIAAGGRPAARAPGRGECYEIMTGAPLPPGCDAVVPVEKTSRDAQGRILFCAGTEKGDNIRCAGADFAVGDRVLDPGALLRPDHVLALATLGIAAVKVRRRARVWLISTGPEVVDDLRAPLQEGQIYNSTSPYLRALLPRLDMEPVPLGTVADDPAPYRQRLRQAAEAGCDIILSTGAVSAGVHDFVPAALQDMGADIFFHKVAIRPGKPILFAQLPDGGPFFFGLPGNPVSTAVGLRFFVLPLLRALQGLPPESPSRGILKDDYSKKKSDLRFFLRAAVHPTAAGLNEIAILPGQQSFMVSPFVRSDAWVAVPEDVNRLKSGDIVDVYQ